MIEEIKSSEHLRAAIQEVAVTDRTLLVQYSATWCMPCMQLRKHVEALSEKIDTRVGVFYIDTAEGGTDVAQAFSISSVPVLRLYVGGSWVDLKGRNVMAIEKEINEIVGV